jgi:hypothetical protein
MKVAYPYPGAMQINSVHVESLHMIQEVELCIRWRLSPTGLEQYLYTSSKCIL